MQSSCTSGIFFQGDGQSQALVNTQLNSSFGNSSNSINGTPRSSLGPSSSDMKNRVLNSVANSGPSVGASSLVTDANSSLSGGPHLQRSTSINTESYMRLPASPMSFTSNNISISGSSVLDGSSIVQQSSHQDQNSQQIQLRQDQKGASSVKSHPTAQTNHVSNTVPQLPNSLTQDPNGLLPMQKKQRLDIRQDDILNQQVIQQMLQRQDSINLQGHNPQLQALIQQQRLIQQHQHQHQQQMLQSMPQMQRAQLQQQQQLRQQLQHNMQPLSCIQRSFDSGICARRLMQYLYHQRNRPADNNILYWRKFVAEYFSPRAKKKWCLSLYDDVGQHALGVFPQAAMEAWQCDICGSKSGRGFETTFEVLPRLSKIKFDSGVIDELLFVDLPRECRFPSGIMMLEYGKAIQESVYEQLRVVREGQLRIIFTPDLKILSWEFCARRHEELFPRRIVAPQVSQLVQVAQKYQTSVNESGSGGVSPQDLQSNCNMFVTAGRQLARNLDLQSLNDLGFSKRYVRCLQISEVVNSMKDLIDFTEEHNIGPIESLKNYPRQASASKLQFQKIQEMEKMVNAQSLPADQNTLNKMIVMHPGLASRINNNHMCTGALNNTAQTGVALGNYQNLLRQNSNPNTLQPDTSSSFNGSNHAQPLPFHGSGSIQNAPVNGLTGPHQHSLKQNQGSSQGNQNLQQHVIQQLLQEMMNSNGGAQQQSVEQNANANGGSGMGGFGNNNTNISNNAMGFGNNNSNILNNAMGMMTPSRNNSFKAAATSSALSGGNGFSFSVKGDTPQNHHLGDLVEDFPGEFAENLMFNDEPGDLGYEWKS
ncbi:putative transcriptional regulator SLK2 [Tasmannia lanceolata]|uniref:putative transcriptional regulator SLK2 n=1 Tax=Tasmannia lanceolata TaxID=3420 RepID=UPI0040640C4D